MTFSRSPAAVFLLLVFRLGHSPAEGAEISVATGAMSTPDSIKRSYTWQIEYRAEISRQFSWSLAWINEGHITGHHRDGLALQAWRNWRLFHDRWIGSIGVGGYQFFDTQALGPGNSRIQHGIAPVGSASLTYYYRSRWFWRMGANVIAPHNGITVNTIALGAGYVLKDQNDPAGTARAGARGFSEWTTGAELTFFGGKTVVNANHGAPSLAASVEYRQGFARYWDWSVAWLHEGDPDVLDRDGVAAQVWLVGAFLGERLTLGLGAGLYYYNDEFRNNLTGGDEQTLGGLLSPTISYRFSAAWQTRFIWHRVICHYHRDTDVFLLGLGRRW